LSLQRGSWSIRCFSSDHHSQKGHHLDHKRKEKTNHQIQKRSYTITLYPQSRLLPLRSISAGVSKGRGCAAHTCISSSAACSWSGRRRTTSTAAASARADEPTTTMLLCCHLLLISSRRRHRSHGGGSCPAAAA